jgi:hypothetical protein
MSEILGLSAKTPPNTFEVVLPNGLRYVLPVPKYQINYQEEDLQLEAWRDEAGYLHKVEARRGLRRVDLEWPYLSDDELSLVRTALKSSEYFRFIYYNSQSGTGGVMQEAYSGNLTYTLYSLRNGEGEWIDVKIAVIER